MLRNIKRVHQQFIRHPPAINPSGIPKSETIGQKPRRWRTFARYDFRQTAETGRFRSKMPTSLRWVIFQFGGFFKTRN